MLESVEQSSCRKSINARKLYYRVRNPLYASISPDQLVVGGHGQEERSGPCGLSNVKRRPFSFDIDHGEDVIPGAGADYGEVIPVAAQVSMPGIISLFEYFPSFRR